MGNYNRESLCILNEDMERFSFYVDGEYISIFYSILPSAYQMKHLRLIGFQSTD